MSAIENVLSRLERVKRKHNGWVARCPAHEDRSPSLDIGVTEDGRVLLNCWRGCTTKAVVGALGLEWKDLFDSSSPPTSLPVTKRVNRLTEVDSRPETREEIEEEWDSGAMSSEEYILRLREWFSGPIPRGGGSLTVPLELALRNMERLLEDHGEPTHVALDAAGELSHLVWSKMDSSPSSPEKTAECLRVLEETKP